jgi:hypothetical protein
VRLLVIFGPPSVGKMTVGRAVTRRSDFRMLHNHAVLEPLLEVFDYGTPPFVRLLGDFRRRIIAEAAGSGTDLLLTFAWPLELEAEAREVVDYIDPYVEAGASIAFVELYADLETRLVRNRTEHRLAEKRSKRDVDWSDGNVRELERYVLNTRPDRVGEPLPGERLLQEHRHLRIDNTDLAADEAADEILGWLTSWEQAP